MNRDVKGIIAGIIVLWVGLQFAQETGFFQTLVISAITTAVYVAAINNFVKGDTKERWITGTIIGLIEVYELLIIPNAEAALPSLGGKAALFLGLIGMWRSLFVLVEITDTIPSWAKKVLNIG